MMELRHAFLILLVVMVTGGWIRNGNAAPADFTVGEANSRLLYPESEEKRALKEKGDLKSFFLFNLLKPGRGTTPPPPPPTPPPTPPPPTIILIPTCHCPSQAPPTAPTTTQTTTTTESTTVTAIPADIIIVNNGFNST